MSDFTKAKVSEDKVLNYLLNVSHPKGGSKAKFFLDHGYSTMDPDRLQKDLIAHARAHPIVTFRSTQYGVNVAVDGEIETPKGTTVRIRTVWEIHAETAPRLVTAYPQEPTHS